MISDASGIDKQLLVDAAKIDDINRQRAVMESDWSQKLAEIDRAQEQWKAALLLWIKGCCRYEFDQCKGTFIPEQSIEKIYEGIKNGTIH